MGYRISKTYTRTGDGGTTGLGDGTRVPKDSARVDSYGDVDELSSVIGVLLTCDVPVSLTPELLTIQQDLLDLGGELSIPGHTVLSGERVNQMETLLDRLNDELDPLEEFVLPGGVQSAAICHLARTVCRRAERKLVRLSHDESVNEIAICYLNRLSDLLFVMARWINKRAGHSDVLWNRNR